MTKRVCQNCHHFKTAGFDNMGWCTHPKRRIGTDVKIFVRALELPCRNDWADDLWQPVDTLAADVVVDAVTAPLAPATPAEIGSLAALERRSAMENTTGHGGGSGEDIVVGDVTTFAASTVSDGDARRDILRKAHGEMRARNRELRPALTPLGFDAELTAANGAPRDRFGLRGAGAPPSHGPNQVALGELGRPFPQLSTIPGEDVRFSSIPEQVDGFDLPLANPRQEVPRIADAPSRPGVRTAWTNQLTELDSPVVRAEEIDFNDSPRSAFREDSRAASRDARCPQPGGARSSAATVAAGHQSSAPLKINELDALEPEPAGSLGIYPRASDDRFADDEWAGRDPSTDVVGKRPQEQRERPTGRAVTRQWSEVDADRATATIALQADFDDEVDFERAIHVSTEPAEIDEIVEQPAPDAWLETPRMCKTCRDFRPAENGERGWCTNKWAFSHRRMVDADELPCETSIGGWWLPHDDLWMSAADVSGHSQPTPLLDLWLAARGHGRGEAEQPELARRRQR